jgi:NAD(P)-dependent dehydrogenase (short-subunit alcohol dehydrogenase family)
LQHRRFDGIAQSLALELAPEILVNAIAPGPILAPPDRTPEDNARTIEATPLARWGGAEEIAKAVLFLARRTSSPANASASMVDGTSTNERSLQPRGMALMTCATSSY